MKTDKEVYNNISFDIFPTRCNITQFIYFWKTALHVSGDISTHHQQHTQLYLQHLVLVKILLITIYHYSALYHKLYIQSKVLLRMGEFVARNMKDWFERINKWKSGCILLVAYVVVLMMHGHTNMKLITIFNSARLWRWCVAFWRQFFFFLDFFHHLIF